MAKVWIFQAHPDIFDIRGALAELVDQTWSVRQHRGEIQAGDTAYLWIAGAAGGLAARASVLSAPAKGPMHEAELRFIGDHRHLGDEEIRVAIRVEYVLAEPIPRAAIGGDAVLESLEILKSDEAPTSPLPTFRQHASQSSSIRPQLQTRAVTSSRS